MRISDCSSDVCSSDLFKLLLARHNRGFRYPDERRLAKVYKSDIGLVVDLVIIRLERHAASPEPKALRGQPFRDLGILHPLPNLPPHNLRDDFVGLRVGGDVMEVRLPDADTLVPIERFKERLALGLGKVEHAARVRIVHEPAVRRPAADDDLLIRSEEHTSELQSLMRISYAVFCLKKKNKPTESRNHIT